MPYPVLALAVLLGLMAVGAAVGAKCPAGMAIAVSLFGLILTVLGFLALFTLGTFFPFVAGFFFAAFGIGRLAAVTLEPDSSQ